MTNEMQTKNRPSQAVKDTAAIANESKTSHCPFGYLSPNSISPDPLSW